MFWGVCARGMSSAMRGADNRVSVGNTRGGCPWVSKATHAVSKQN